MRRADKAVQALEIEVILTSQVWQICKALDEEVERFRTRRLTAEYPYVWLDATVRHEAPQHRAGGRNPPAVCRSRPLKLEAA
jgi:transposase-like protein